MVLRCSSIAACVSKDGDGGPGVYTCTYSGTVRPAGVSTTGDELLHVRAANKYTMVSWGSWFCLALIMAALASVRDADVDGRRLDTCVSMSCLRTPAVPSIQVLPSFERRTASRGRRSREEQGDESAGGSACFSTRCARRGQILQCTRRWSQGGPPSVPRQLQARGCRQPHNVSEWSLNHKLHVGAAYELSSSDVAGVMHVCAPSLQVRFVV
jgi:hypothetical protein